MQADVAIWRDCEINQSENVLPRSPIRTCLDLFFFDYQMIRCFMGVKITDHHLIITFAQCHRLLKANAFVLEVGRTHVRENRWTCNPIYS